MSPKLGTAIRASRKALGLEQKELAGAAGVSRVYISEVERDLRNPSIAVVLRIARALRTTVDGLTERAIQEERERVHRAAKKLRR